MSAPRNITGKLIFDPNVILQDLATALRYFSELLATPFDITEEPDDMILEVGDVGLNVYVSDEAIFVGQLVYQNFEAEEVDLGEFTFDQKNDAIAQMIATIAVTLHQCAGEDRDADRLLQQMKVESELSLIGKEEVPGSKMNHLRK